MNPMKKCSGCCCLRIEDDYIYGNKINKSCVKCRGKRKRNREPKTNTTKDNDLTRHIRHQRLFRRLNVEFLERAAKPVHMYKMKYAFVDIHDCLIHSDKDFSHTNY